MPIKLKRHIENYIQFFGAWIIAEITIDCFQQLGGLEHYTLITNLAYWLFIAISLWFVWRAYTGMERDGDFFEKH